MIALKPSHIYVHTASFLMCFHTYYTCLLLSPSRSKAWLLAIGREDLLDSNLVNRRVCSDHFSPYMYNCPDNPQSSRLSISAIPSALRQDHQAASSTQNCRDVGCQAGSIGTTEATTSTDSYLVNSWSQTAPRHNPVKLLQKISALRSRLRGYKFRKTRKPSEKYTVLLSFWTV